jgi:DNA-binding protein YbaB
VWTVTFPLNENLDELLQNYQRKRDEMTELQERLRSASSTVTSDSGLVTVTIGGRGEITELKFNSQAYRKMPAAQLSQVILDTIAKAKRAASAQVRGAIAPLLPKGMNFDALMDGKFDINKVLPDKLLDLDEIGRMFPSRLARRATDADPDES